MSETTTFFPFLLNVIKEEKFNDNYWKSCVAALIVLGGKDVELKPWQ